MITGFDTSAKTGEWVQMESSYHRTPAMALPRLKGVLD